MLSDNLKALRKNRGVSQEELAAQLHVVRQTVSKWEKGLSVPDADLLVRLAEYFEVPVSRLLGTPIEEADNHNELAEQLMKINEQLVIRNRRSRRVWHVVAWTVGALLALQLVLFVLRVCVFAVQPGSRVEHTQAETVDEGQLHADTAP